MQVIEEDHRDPEEGLALSLQRGTARFSFGGVSDQTDRHSVREEDRGEVLEQVDRPEIEGPVDRTG